MKTGAGFVWLTIRVQEGDVSVKVTNSGECDPRVFTQSGSGIGLANVRRRLELCYRAGARFEAQTAGGVTTFSRPRYRRRKFRQSLLRNK